MTVGGAAATSIVVVSSTRITAVTPAGAAGARDVRVTLSGGQAATLAGAFTYTAPTTPSPTLTSIAPVSGPTAGGTAVTLTGTNFAAGATVTVGGAAATSVVVASSTRITAVTPAGTAGSRDVRVTLSGGQAVTLAGAFTYTSGTSTDSDGDGLANEWETLYGLNPNSAAGNDGAAGDPDADGRVNSAEQTAGSHPRGTLKRYLAEGVSNGFFATRFADRQPAGVDRPRPADVRRHHRPHHPPLRRRCRRGAARPSTRSTSPRSTAPRSRRRWKPTRSSCSTA